MEPHDYAKGYMGEGSEDLAAQLNKRQSLVPLVSGLLLLLVGIATFWRGHASWYGAGWISGAQAEVYAFVCIAFALVFFFIAFRRKR